MNINTSGGWVKLHYKIRNSSLWNDHTAYAVFTRLLLMAHHKDNNGSVKMGGTQVSLKRGQLAVSRRELSEITGVKQSTLRDVLVRLQTDQRIITQSDSRTTVITICNWSKYQGTDDSRTTADRTAGRLDDDQRPLSQKTKEERSKKVITNVITADDPLKHELEEFTKMRKAIKKPVTEHGLALIREKVTNLYPNDTDSQRLCLNQSIENSWQGVFELKPGVKRRGKTSWT